jgi:hypothetical protein
MKVYEAATKYGVRIATILEYLGSRGFETRMNPSHLLLNKMISCLNGADQQIMSLDKELDFKARKCQKVYDWKTEATKEKDANEEDLDWREFVPRTSKSSYCVDEEAMIMRALQGDEVELYGF